MSAGRAAGPGVQARHGRQGSAAEGFPPPGISEVHENERAAKEMLAAFNHWDLDSALAYLDPEVTLRSITPGVGGRIPGQGREALRDWLQELIAGGLRVSLDLAHIRAAGGVVVALGHIHLERAPAGEIRPEGAPAEGARLIPCRWVLKFREGRVADVQVFADAPVPA